MNKTDTNRAYPFAAALGLTDDEYREMRLCNPGFAKPGLSAIFDSNANSPKLVEHAVRRDQDGRKQVVN